MNSNELNPELRVLVLTKRHVGSGNEIGEVLFAWQIKRPLHHSDRRYLLIMFRLARVWRLKTVQHGSVFITSRQYCGVKSDAVHYPLRITREVLLRDKRHHAVAGFDRVKLQEGEKLKSRQTLSQLWFDVDLVVRLFFVFIAYVSAN